MMKMLMALFYMQSWSQDSQTDISFTYTVRTLGFYHEVPFRVNTFGHSMPGPRVRSEFLHGNCFPTQRTPSQGEEGLCCCGNQ